MRRFSSILGVLLVFCAWESAALAQSKGIFGEPSIAFPSPVTWASTLRVDVTPLPDGSSQVFIYDIGNDTILSSLKVNGHGGSQPAAPAPIGVTASKMLVVADLDGNGLPDVVLIGAAFNRVAILLANSDGSYKPPSSYGVGNNPSSVIIADLNNDGKPDLAVANSGSSNVSILLGNGDGTFQAAVGFPAGNAPSSLAAGDFNADGKIDLVVASAGSQGGAAVLLGNGDGTFHAPVGYAFGSSVTSILAIDFNRDGVLDLALANAVSGKVSILPGNGNGTFRTSVDSDAGGGSTYISSGDFNHDGLNDLAVLHRELNSISILTGRGDGTFGPPVNYAVAVSPPVLSQLDYDGDGNLDFIIANGVTGVPLILIGNSDGTFQASLLYAAGKNPSSIAVADFNNDGKLDLVTANSGSNDASILLSIGGGKFQAATPITIGQGAGGRDPQPSAIAAADLNGDTWVDLVVADQNAGDVAILLGNGNGTFQPALHYPTGNNASSLVIVDLNGDGFPDIIVTNPDTSNNVEGAGSISVLISRGGGFFNPAVNYSAGTHPLAVSISDFDRDGKLDLAVANAGLFGVSSGSVSILLGHGDGTFQQPALTHNLSGNPQSLAMGDVNRDGAEDLIVGTAAPGGVYTLAVLLGNGDGSFQTLPTQPTDLGPHSMVIADFDLDGKPDLVVAHCCGPKDLTFLVGNGDGTFQPEVHFPGGVSPAGIASADFDGDGKPDLVVAAAGGSGSPSPGGIVVLFNNFTAPPPPLSNVSAASFKAGPAAPESIVAGLGAHLASTTDQAPGTPLPTNLHGTTVNIKDSSGATFLAPLYYISPTQVNYEIPPGVALGASTVTIDAGDGSSLSATLQIANVSPGLFELNADGLAAAAIQRFPAGGTPAVEQVYQLDSQNFVVAAPIDLGPSSDQLYLLLFASGVRGVSSLANVSLTIGGITVPVQFAGAQGDFVGLDQINAGPLPRALAGRGKVAVVFKADGVAAQTVNLTFQ